MKELKKQLSLLKNSVPRDTDKIKQLSHFIRRKISHSSTDVSSSQDMSRNLASSFWKTCQTIFDASKKVSPCFSCLAAYDYFKNLLTDRNGSSFSTPSWFPPMPNASVPFATHPPTYQEVNKAIQKAKNRSAPCPLDQVSIIVFKKCPILRTYLTKLLAECWSSSDIPKIWGSGQTILLYKMALPTTLKTFALLLITRESFYNLLLIKILAPFFVFA